MTPLKLAAISAAGIFGIYLLSRNQASASTPQAPGQVPGPAPGPVGGQEPVGVTPSAAPPQSIEQIGPLTRNPFLARSQSQLNSILSIYSGRPISVDGSWGLDTASKFSEWLGTREELGNPVAGVSAAAISALRTREAAENSQRKVFLAMTALDRQMRGRLA